LTLKVTEIEEIVIVVLNRFLCKCNTRTHFLIIWPLIGWLLLKVSIADYI